MDQGNNQLEHATLEDYNNVDLLDLWLWDEPTVLEEEYSPSTTFLGGCSSFETIFDEHDPPFISSLPLDSTTYYDHQVSFNQCLTTSNTFDFHESPPLEQLITYPQLPDDDFENWWNSNLSLLARINEPAPLFDTPQVTEVGSSNATVMEDQQESTAFANDDGIRKRQLRPKQPKLSGLELEEIQKYFHLPIVKAAKELRVGVTVLKKRCRELNIARWPHRKIKSLKCLIDNVKELGMIDENEIEMLEEDKKTLEKVPGLNLTMRTKKLRQACFKANYKRRRLHRSPL